MNAQGLELLVVIHGNSTGPTSLVPADGTTAVGEEPKQSDGEPLVTVVGEILKVVSARGSVEKELEDMTKELGLRYEELNFVYEIGGPLVHIKDLKEALDYIIRRAKELIEADLAFVHIPTKGVRRLLHSNQTECPRELVEDQSAQKVTSRLVQALDVSRDYLSKTDLEHEPVVEFLLRKCSHMLIVPVLFEEKIEGILLFARISSGQKFTIGDKSLIAVVADMVSGKVTNAELFRDLNRFLISLMRSFVSAIEAKDPYTSGHSERVSQIALAIGGKLGLDDKEMELLNYASILHDVGKIGVPEHILNKPARLTADEFAKIKEHPVKGCKILQPIKNLKECLPGILYHHERIDGRGYPEGIPGHQIPRAAKIIAVADAYDAMTTDRAYRKALKVEEAVEELVRVSGAQIDAKIAQVFVSKCLDARLAAAGSAGEK
jgi:HD-GYP domain-containing protein (c-di-GMP phosphodiesterase class II)